MTNSSDSFFTVVGCMDGRCQEVVAAFGRHTFGADFGDTITDAGIVEIVANSLTDEILFDLQAKLLISLDKHKSKGVIVFGHTDCAGDPSSESIQKEHIKKTAQVVSHLIESMIPVIGIFVKRIDNNPSEWVVEEVKEIESV